MADDSDVLLKFVEQQWIEAKQAEDQRAAITNVILLIVSAVIGYLAQKGLSRNMLFLSSLLIVLGVYGAITSAKLYERHQFHIARLQQWRQKLNDIHKNAQLLDLKDKATNIHKSNFPYLSNLRLYYLWIGLHIMIAAVGSILSIYIAYKY